MRINLMLHFIHFVNADVLAHMVTGVSVGTQRSLYFKIGLTFLQANVPVHATLLYAIARCMCSS